MQEFISTGATFSPCRRYRYTLNREWREGEGTCTFVMLNPSTATEQILDPTVRRCVGYAQDWGYKRLQVLNIFAFRATDPKELYLVADPVGPENDDAIVIGAGGSDLVVCAWGNHGKLNGRGREVLGLLSEYAEPMVLAMTKANHPNHPLYLKASLRPVPFP